MAAFVLVHGAWHGGWCWGRVARLLRGTGAEVWAPTLSGLGERAHLSDLVEAARVDLDLHIQDVTRLLEFEGLEDVVLVGHAYAGMVITGAAEVCPERLSHLVYVNGVIPGDGESMVDQLVPVRGAEFAAWVRGYGERGEGYLPPPATAEELGERWGIPDAADREWMLALVTGQPAAAMMGRVRVGNPAARAIPRSFVVGAEAGFEPVARRAEGLGWMMYRLDSGHDPMVSHPRELAEILLGIGASF